MRTRAILIVAASALLGWLGTQVTAQEKTSEPPFTSAQLEERMLQSCAEEAVIWGMPIVSVNAMRQAFFRDAKANYNDIVFWSKPSDCFADTSGGTWALPTFDKTWKLPDIERVH